MITQLIPFNPARFDECMAWISLYAKKPLTQYHMMKLHVMTDVFHVLKHGFPVIGGAITKWKYGPVVKRAYDLTRHRAYQWEKGSYEGPFEITQKRETEFCFSPKVAVSDEEFSASEIEAMARAWDKVGDMPWDESQSFFHDPKASFLGRVWAEAGDFASPVDWNRIIDAYDLENGTDHGHIKQLISLGV